MKKKVKIFKKSLKNMKYMQVYKKNLKFYIIKGKFLKKLSQFSLNVVNIFKNRKENMKYMLVS